METISAYLENSKLKLLALFAPLPKNCRTSSVHTPCTHTYTRSQHTHTQTVHTCRTSREHHRMTSHPFACVCPTLSKHAGSQCLFEFRRSRYAEDIVFSLFFAVISETAPTLCVRYFQSDAGLMAPFCCS